MQLLHFLHHRTKLHSNALALGGRKIVVVQLSFVTKHPVTERGALPIAKGADEPISLSQDVFVCSICHDYVLQELLPKRSLLGPRPTLRGSFAYQIDHSLVVTGITVGH